MPTRTPANAAADLSATGTRNMPDHSNGVSSSPPSTSMSKPSASASHHGASAFSSIPEAVEAIKRGEFVVVLDDEDRENEGDLICAASECSTEMMAWMIRHTSGYVCISLPKSRLDELEIPMMVPNNTEKHRTAYTITVDYKHGTTTGISAADRSLTARKLAPPRTSTSSAGPPVERGHDATLESAATAADFTRPGHMVPLRYTDGGVLERKGHTEAAVDLCLLASLPPAGLLCELVTPNDPQGRIAARDQCFGFAREHGLKVITIEALRRYRLDEASSGHGIVERGLEMEKRRASAHANGF